MLHKRMQPRVARDTIECGSASVYLLEQRLQVSTGILTVRVVKGVKEFLEDLSPHGELDGESDDGVLDTAPDAAEAFGCVGEIHVAAVDRMLRSCSDSCISVVQCC